MKIKERGNRILTGETTISKKFRYILLLMCVCIVFWLSALQVQAAAPVLSAKNLSVTVGHTKTLKLQNVSGKVTWSSSNAKTAVVSSTGPVTGKRAGSCVITAKYRGKAYQCMVKVYRTGIEWMPNYLQKKNVPAKNQGRVVLAGSSYIEYWTSASTAFAPLKTVNNGIGGSTIQDWMTLYEKLIVNYKPSAVVVYVGSNDIAGGKSGKATAAQACLLLKRLKTKLPGVPIYYISIAPSIRRWNLWKENQICNKAVSSFCSKTSGVSFIHCTPYLLKNGKLRKELYRSDQLHFNQKGYQVWNQVIPARIKKDLK